MLLGVSIVVGIRQNNYDHKSISIQLEFQVWNSLCEIVVVVIILSLCETGLPPCRSHFVASDVGTPLFLWFLSTIHRAGITRTLNDGFCVTPTLSACRWPEQNSEVHPGATLSNRLGTWMDLKFSLTGQHMLGSMLLIVVNNPDDSTSRIITAYWKPYFLQWSMNLATVKEFISDSIP